MPSDQGVAYLGYALRAAQLQPVIGAFVHRSWRHELSVPGSSVWSRVFGVPCFESSVLSRVFGVEIKAPRGWIEPIGKAHSDL